MSNIEFIERSIPVKKKDFKVFDELPPAGVEAFNFGVPLDDDSKYADVIILYSPDLKMIGHLDNTHSAASSTYTTSVTSGFTFSMGQKISTGFKMEAGVVFAKAEWSIGFELSFSEQWNTSHTETTSVTVPGEKQAFLYQGTLRSIKLRFDPEKKTYRYTEVGNFETKTVKTVDTPITGGVNKVNTRVHLLHQDETA